uniref:Uncharacterized protein n=1 Tax=Arion vulgaris TaxID=1028688 RepID=A0A0B7AGP3_9EUPU
MNATESRELNVNTVIMLISQPQSLAALSNLIIKIDAITVQTVHLHNIRTKISNRTRITVHL